MLLSAIILIILGFVMQYFLIFGPGQNKPVRMLVFKTLSSVCFAVSGIIAYQQTCRNTVNLLIVFGLIFGMAGDILLHLRFVAFKNSCMIFGILSFLTGHIVYIAAMLFAESEWYAGLIFTVILLPVVRKYIFSHDTDFGNMLPLGTLYMAVELFFSGISMSRMLIRLTPASLVFFIGSIFFVFSDIMWILQNFAVHKKPIYRTLCLIPYYLAQNLFVISLIL